MKIGYARVSTDDQRVDLQTLALKQSGCERIFTDKGVSGGTLNRPGLRCAIARLQPGDTLVVWRLDRLGRSLVRLVQLIDEFGKKGIEFISLTESIDTSSSGGRLVFHMMAALSEFERMLISERTRAGMEAARQRGSRLGRPPLLTAVDIEAARQAIVCEGEKIDSVASRYRVSVKTLRRRIREKAA